MSSKYSFTEIELKKLLNDYYKKCAKFNNHEDLTNTQRKEYSEQFLKKKFKNFHKIEELTFPRPTETIDNW